MFECVCGLRAQGLPPNPQTPQLETFGSNGLICISRKIRLQDTCGPVGQNPELMHCSRQAPLNPQRAKAPQSSKPSILAHS